MNDRFLQHIESLHPSFDALLACIPFTFSELPKQLPDAGIYLFTEGDRPVSYTHLDVYKRQPKRNDFA